jgi:hypothetical protein
MTIKMAVVTKLTNNHVEPNYLIRGQIWLPSYNQSLQDCSLTITIKFVVNPSYGRGK